MDERTTDRRAGVDAQAVTRHAAWRSLWNLLLSRPPADAEATDDVDRPVDGHDSDGGAS